MFTDILQEDWAERMRCEWNEGRLKGVRHQQLSATDLKEGRPSRDASQRTRVDTTSTVYLRDPQLPVTHHGGGGEGAGVAPAEAITGLRGAGGGDHAGGGMGMEARGRKCRVRMS